MAKQTYWITDPNGGAKALVEGAEERDRWVHIQGWSESGEPVSGDMVWAFNPNTGGRAKLPHDPLADYWKGVGFVPSAPPEPVDLTKDPALRDQPAADKPVAEPVEKTETTAKK